MIAILGLQGSPVGVQVLPPGVVNTDRRVRHAREHRCGAGGERIPAIS
jgi:hypothetical protein